MAADLEARVRELESAMRELNDREALRDLRYRYHEYINEGKFANIVDLFTEDGELEFGPLGKAKGRDGILAFFKRLGPSSAGTPSICQRPSPKAPFALSETLIPNGTFA